MRILISFLINLSCVVTTIHAAGIYDCPSRIQRLRPLHVYVDSCLLYVRSEKSWEDARKSCRSMGGDLVTIKDADKETYILNSMRDDHWSADNVWIGATDQRHEGDWEWIDGTKVTFNKFADGQGTNHATGFFFANGSPEDCAVLRRDDVGKWHDYPCSPPLGIGYMYTYICEFRKIIHNTRTTTTIPTTITTTETTITTTVINHCNPDPCNKHGSCTNGVTGFKCNCHTGYIGQTCQNNCDPDPCNDHGSCLNGLYGHTCVCNMGYTGKTCQSIQTCDKFGLVMALSSSTSVSVTESKSCSGTSADALLITFCSAPPVSSWRKGVQINNNCSNFVKYIPIGQWKNNTFIGVAGVLVSCDGGHIQMISQKCGQGASLKNVTLSDVNTFYSVLW